MSMKRILLTLVPAALLAFGANAYAEDAATAKDCAAKQKDLDDANAAAKADLSTCKDKKGKEKTECEKPLKEKAKADGKAAKDKAKEAKTALDCCKNPKKKGCTK